MLISLFMCNLKTIINFNYLVLLFKILGPNYVKLRCLDFFNKNFLNKNSFLIYAHQKTWKFDLKLCSRAKNFFRIDVDKKAKMGMKSSSVLRKGNTRQKAVE